jgi:predicted lipoprotein with Yx(FWY)xxD motif
MRMRAWAAVAVIAMVTLGACGGSSSKSSSSSSTTANASAGTTTSVATTSGATLGTATNAKLGKTIVVDSAGRTVYMYMPDGTSKTSTVPAGIAANWPPVKATGTPSAGVGLDQTKLTVDMQSNGSDQVAYGGHLLYTFVGDKNAGDANGQGLGNVWFSVSPTGDKVS